MSAENARLVVSFHSQIVLLTPYQRDIGIEKG